MSLMRYLGMRGCMAAAIGATLMLGLVGGADANPSNGMIDGNYATVMPAYYLQEHLRPGVLNACVQITSGGNNTLTGTVKTKNHLGTWTLRRTVSLQADRGARREATGDNPPGGGLESCNYYRWHNRENDERNLTNWVNTLTAQGYTEEEARDLLGLPLAERTPSPTNWCGQRRAIKPAHGWTGRLKSDASELRVQARDHVLNMPGPIGLQYNTTCP